MDIQINQPIPRGDEYGLKTTLLQELEHVRDEYCDYAKGRVTLFHHHGYLGRRRVQVFVENQNNLLIAKSYEGFKKEVLDYLDDANWNGNRNPHSFRPLLERELSVLVPDFQVDYREDLAGKEFEILFGREGAPNRLVTYNKIPNLQLRDVRRIAARELERNPEKMNKAIEKLRERAFHSPLNLHEHAQENNRNGIEMLELRAHSLKLLKARIYQETIVFQSVFRDHWQELIPPGGDQGDEYVLASRVVNERTQEMAWRVMTVEEVRESLNTRQADIQQQEHGRGPRNPIRLVFRR